ncbi:MAG: hypothetical protein M3327_05360 [Actinomycetota bacterium]|nr:hypothetical protein [Actinomycetota bacterium]
MTEAVLSVPEAALIRGGRVDRSVLEGDELLIAREGRLSVFYAPFDNVNAEARLVLLGLTPGWQQMCIAIETYRAERHRGASDADAQRAVKTAASFAGMRPRIAGWLDDLGVNQALGVERSAELFDEPASLHTTSLVRYPVFVGNAMANYRGVSPRPQASPLLRSLISRLLIPELRGTPEAVIVPMGSAVTRALLSLEVPFLDRCLIGFPHPSGANGWANRQFAANRDRLRAAVASWTRARTSGARSP